MSKAHNLLVTLVLSLATMVGILSAAPAVAQSTEPQATAWQFQVTPYLWAAGLSGRVGLGIGSSVPVEESFSDLFKHLNMGAMAEFEGRRDRWGFIFDGMYIKLGTTKPLGGDRLEAKLDVKQQLYQLAGTYRVGEGEAPVDLVFGARYVFLDTDLALTGPAGVSASKTVSFVDGLVGARMQAPLSDRLSLNLYADVGTGGSKLSWQALAGVSYDFSKSVSGKLGYRYLSIDYEKSRFIYDMGQGGFYLGVGIRL